jgi:hypothetical protein
LSDLQNFVLTFKVVAHERNQNKIYNHPNKETAYIQYRREVHYE